MGRLNGGTSRRGRVARSDRRVRSAVQARRAHARGAKSPALVVPKARLGPVGAAEAAASSRRKRSRRPSACERRAKGAVMGAEARTAIGRCRRRGRAAAVLQVLQHPVPRGWRVVVEGRAKTDNCDCDVYFYPPDGTRCPLPRSHAVTSLARFAAHTPERAAVRALGPHGAGVSRAPEALWIDWGCVAPAVGAGSVPCPMCSVTFAPTGT